MSQRQSFIVADRRLTDGNHRKQRVGWSCFALSGFALAYFGNGTIAALGSPRRPSIAIRLLSARQKAAEKRLATVCGVLARKRSYRRETTA